MKKEDLEKEYRECKEETTWNSLAMDIAKALKGREKAKDIGLTCMTVVSVGLIALSITLGVINYKNDCRWRELFSSYDFVSQDGTGINSVNSGEQGDLLNGSESEAKER